MNQGASKEEQGNPPTDGIAAGAVVLVDNRDSFTMNLAHGFAEVGADVAVLDGDTLGHRAHDETERGAPRAAAAAVLAAAPALVCIGPGPRGPDDLPALVDFVRALDGNTVLFGVCLGMQALTIARGGDVVRANAPVHGMRRAITHEQSGVLSHLPSPLFVMRYHSLICTAFPPSLDVTAWCDGEAMAVEDPITGSVAVQFHPESVGTAGGSVMLHNILLRGRGESIDAHQRRSLGRVGAIPRATENFVGMPQGALDVPVRPAIGSVVDDDGACGTIFRVIVEDKMLRRVQ